MLWNTASNQIRPIIIIVHCWLWLHYSFLLKCANRCYYHCYTVENFRFFSSSESEWFDFVCRTEQCHCCSNFFFIHDCSLVTQIKSRLSSRPTRRKMEFHTCVTAFASLFSRSFYLWNVLQLVSFKYFCNRLMFQRETYFWETGISGLLSWPLFGHFFRLLQ